jgi:hypothetical protein
MASDYLTIISALIGVPLWALMIFIIWTVVWKLLALWKSAKNNSVIWFIILGVINTAGILEILYIFIFSKMKCCQLNKGINKKTPVKKISKKSTRKK